MKFHSYRAVQTILLASNFHAVVSNGLFRRTNSFAWGRTTHIMSTSSQVDFKWSVKLIGESSFYVGIATTAEHKDSSIYEYDENAILYSSHGDIRVGSRITQSGLSVQTNGDVIHFEFLSQDKKLLIELVRALKILKLFGYDHDQITK